MSILEFIATPLKYLPWITWKSAREPYIYEHIIGPVVVALPLSFLPTIYAWVAYVVLISVHLVHKELYDDYKKWGFMNWENVIERTYGLLLAALTLGALL